MLGKPIFTGKSLGEFIGTSSLTPTPFSLYPSPEGLHVNVKQGHVQRHWLLPGKTLVRRSGEHTGSTMTTGILQKSCRKKTGTSPGNEAKYLRYWVGCQTKG